MCVHVFVCYVRPDVFVPGIPCAPLEVTRTFSAAQNILRMYKGNVWHFKL